MHGGTRSSVDLAGATPLTDALDLALADDEGALSAIADLKPGSRRDRDLALALVHDLHVSPVHELGHRVWLQHHPVVAGLKMRLERELLDGLSTTVVADTSDAVGAMRRLANHDLVPDLYRWLATEASLDELRRYVALEGGPDGGFDDLVALSQVGLDGEPKLELATNYWDEMGRGEGRDVHTELHRRMATALGITDVDRRHQPVEALERSLLSTTLATTRALQPELIGALGFIELQAGPRCRQMVRALQRTGAPDDAIPFYAEHAEADPRHGKDWLDRVVRPLATGIPDWAPRMVQGAMWRSTVNARFFDAARRLLGVVDAPTAARRLSA